jgi:hypothetical protein
MRRGNNPKGCNTGIHVIGITHSTAREGYGDEGSSRRVLESIDARNSERTVRRVLLPEFCTNRPENRPFPSHSFTSH